MHSASSTKDTRLRAGVVIEALPVKTEKTWGRWVVKVLHYWPLVYFVLTQNANPPDWAISSFITSAYHQLIISDHRHGEVHEVPASDVNFSIDVACLSEHDLANKKHLLRFHLVSDPMGTKKPRFHLTGSFVAGVRSYKWPYLVGEVSWLHQLCKHHGII